MRLFISHSSKDLQFVELLVDFLRNALNLPAAEIRCTSLEGHRLPGGADIRGQLRYEVSEAEAFIGVISYSSLKSVYSVFELGARWGAGKVLIPLLAPGLSARDLEPPLDDFNALASDSGPQLHQLVENLARQLGLTAESPAAYGKYLERLLDFASITSAEGPVPSVAAAAPPLTPPAPTVPSVGSAPEEVIRRYCEKQWPDDFQMQAYCRKQQREALAELQSLRAEGVPAETFAEIRRGCASQWPDDFSMRLYCERQQLEAYRQLRRENGT